MTDTKNLKPATLAIVGRPNVGKSTLFNRIIGRRRAIVGDEPGITRDRLYGEADWNGRRFTVVDTGGIIPEDKDLIPAEIFRQARVALQEADVVVMVVDGRSEVAGPDIELARLLLRSGKPVFLAVNKIDAPKLEAHIHDFHRLGIRELLPISAEHGTGVAELLDEVVKILPEAVWPAADEAVWPGSPTREDGPEARPAQTEVKIAIIGRPNVGKSTLLNKLTESERAIVSPIPGTTRDAVDELVERDGQSYRFIDTAGIRRKGKTELMAEKLSVVMARKHLESADIALLIIDATEGVTALDANIAGYAHESGRSVIIVVNKWDLVAQRAAQAKAPRTGSGGMASRKMRRDSTFAIARSSGKGIDRNQYEERVRGELKFLNYAPVVFVSAVSGRNVDKIFDLVAEVARQRRKRIPTGEMNRFLAHIDFERASVPVSRRVKILYMTQAATSPPTFILFTDRNVKLHFSYERFLENQIRHAFGFQGTPIWIKVRARS
ncbi:MAG TPA: ribosome biogenesis GTPase Der [Terriglobales bacterium]|nr:ribosome biogenesis GTPase Der [Terriglobales bacterium]